MKRVAVLLVALATLAAPFPALAFDDYGILCGNENSLGIAFSSSPSWSLAISAGPDNGKTLQSAVTEGRNMWVGTEIEHWSGGAALGGGSPTFQMKLIDTSSAAITDCQATVSIAFDSDRIADFRDGDLVLSGLSAHEWGHAWGLGHSGRYDSFGGGVSPTLSTCWNDFEEQRFVSQDDSAGIQFQTDKSGTFGSATANSSFEENTQWWGFQNVSSSQVFLSGGTDGSPNFLRFSGPASSTAIYSTTRMTDYFDGDQIGADIKARANYKRGVNASGHVLVVAKWRHVDYPGSSKDVTCQLDPSTLNQQASIGSFEFQVSIYCYPSTTWNYCTTSAGNVTSSDSAGASPDGVDARVVVYNRMTVLGGSEYTNVDVDRVRLLVVPS